MQIRYGDGQMLIAVSDKITLTDILSLPNRYLHLPRPSCFGCYTETCFHASFLGVVLI